jgi:hypothetical protein
MTANTLLTISMISRDAAVVLGNTLDLAKRVNRDFDSDFGVKSAQIGQTINLRRPIRPTVRTGSVVDIQPIVETYSPLSFTVPYGADYALTSQELTFSVEDYMSKVVEPTVQRIASEIEAGGQALYKKFYGLIGTPGVALTGGAAGTSLPAIARALALLNKNLAPTATGRKTLLNDPDFNAVLATSNLTYFNPGAEISKMYTDGYQGDFSSFRVFMNQLVNAHTNGTYAGTPAVAATVAANSVWAATSTLSTDGWTSGSTSLKAGDVFTIAGVKMVNPMTKQALSTEQQFVVVNDVSDTTGSATLTISPSIVTTGGFQNVSRAPADGDLITMAGASGVVTQNALAFDRDAIVLAAKELAPYSVGFGKSTTDDQTMLPIRVQQMPDIRTNQEILRFDVMAAWGTLYENLGIRICTT